MSILTYYHRQHGEEKPLVWLHGQIRTPPLGTKARIEMGYNLRLLQQGAMLGMPRSRPMKSIGRACHELRARDAGVNWRLIYRVDDDAIVVVGVFAKTSRPAAERIVNICRRRLALYDAAAKG
jgi:phage-related protein